MDALRCRLDRYYKVNTLSLNLIENPRKRWK